MPSERMKDGRFLLAGIEQHSGDSWCWSTWVMASPAGCSGPGKEVRVVLELDMEALVQKLP